MVRILLQIVVNEFVVCKTSMRIGYAFCTLFCDVHKLILWKPGRCSQMALRVFSYYLYFIPKY